MIHITKTGQIITRNRKHIKAAPIIAKQYPWDQLSKNTVHMIDNIQKHFEKLTQPNLTHPHHRKIQEGTSVNIMSDKQQRNNTSRIVVTNEQKEDPYDVTVKVTVRGGK